VHDVGDIQANPQNEGQDHQPPRREGGREGGLAGLGYEVAMHHVGDIQADGQNEGQDHKGDKTNPTPDDVSIKGLQHLLMLGVARQELDEEDAHQLTQATEEGDLPHTLKVA